MSSAARRAPSQAVRLNRRRVAAATSATPASIWTVGEKAMNRQSEPMGLISHEEHLRPAVDKQVACQPDTQEPVSGPQNPDGDRSDLARTAFSNGVRCSGLRGSALISAAFAADFVGHGIFIETQVVLHTATAKGTDARLLN